MISVEQTGQQDRQHIKSKQKRQLVSALSKDRVRNVNLINFVQQYPIHTLDQVGDSYLIRGTSDHQWVYLSSGERAEFEELVGRLTDEDEYFAIIEDWMMADLIKNHQLLWKLSCVKLYFPEDAKLAKPIQTVDELQVEDATYIYENSKYKEYTSVEYITERIQKGTALGIRDEEKLVAWLMTHDDGAMGFLHVMPEYRRCGLAINLTYEMIWRLRMIGQLPFVHIEEDNLKSMSLALKSGFVKDRLIHWFQRKPEDGMER